MVFFAWNQFNKATMILNTKIKNKVRSFLYKLHILEDNSPKDYYVSRISKKAPWVYVAYISGVFYNKDNANVLNSHQNQREALAQVEIFNEMGYNVYVQQYLSRGKIPKRKFDIVFGHEPNFVRAALQNPQAIKIHYVPGAYIDHRNGQIIKMTDYVNRTYNSCIPYRRLLEYDDPNHDSKAAYDLADRILMIGSKYTIETFPEYLRSKIVTIHQSTQLTRTVGKIQYAPSNEFFFMGSGGNLLKGISLLVEYFSKHQEYIINIVGPIEQDVREALSGIVTSNIKMHGFVDVNSDDMLEIMGRCNFIIYPSGSEGMPGAVLNSMKNGLIPIVTRWAAFDEVEEYGYILDDWTTDAIDKGVKWSNSLSKDKIIALKEKSSQYVDKTYSLDIFKQEFRDFFVTVIRAKQ